MFSGVFTITFGASICHLSFLLVSARVLDNFHGISCFVIFNVTRAVLETQPNILQKWQQIQGSTVFFAHFPKDRNCEVCLRTKMTNPPCRRRIGEAPPRQEKFGDLTTGDHKVFNEEGEPRNNHRYAVVAQDLATQRIQSYPCKTKSSHETERS